MRKEFYWIGVLLLAMWLVRIVDATIPYRLTDYGLQPRTWDGLAGILFMPFLHADFSHLFSNSVSLVILLALLVASRRSPWMLLVVMYLVGAALLWLFGRNANHVGASGLVFGLVGFFLVGGLVRRSPIPIAVAIAVGILFGGTLLSGILPSSGAPISWDGHLCGLIGGAATAYLAGEGRQPFSRGDRG
ncbi:rhomboid family intramembrane serine protease [Roseiconus nitratireducens]|uniref:Rhomboid family intramembrane serine protease n=1 Tax=Roseiconus nitratireducens TaxID=2605748 RepID=A0A5M6DDE2_9BACT|nr:rhomboid family intramembrane serine protease [Roseiconus nitratireducens]KAA5545538.1 rhomboid family intramembrane serine protease [Roseiconus nitratireducens]